MHIGIDARLSGLRHAGIGRYTQNLIIELLSLTQTDHLTLFFHDDKQALEVLAEHYENPQITKVYIPVKHYSLAEQFKLPKIFSEAKLDLLHVPHFNIPIAYSGKMIVTIHDLLWHEHTGTQATTLHPFIYLLKYFFYRFVTYCAVFKAASILTPTQTVKKTITKYYPSAKHKINVTYEGGYTKQPTIETNNIKRKSKTLLYVGSLYPHKNIRLVLNALTELPEYTVLIASSRSVFGERIERKVKRLDLQDRVKFLGFVPDSELVKLYQEATALIQPSLSEGFGLTGVEAMSLGTPILASDIPIFKEIYQDAAIFFSPYSVSSFLYAIHRLETVDQAQNIQRGLSLIKRYSWKKMAQQTYAAYRNCL